MADDTSRHRLTDTEMTLNLHIGLSLKAFSVAASRVISLLVCNEVVEKNAMLFRL